MADKDVRGMLEAFEPVLAEVVVTQARPAGRCRPTSWRRSPSRCSAPTGSRWPPRLDDALDAAIALAEEEGDLGGVRRAGDRLDRHGGEARTLLGGS
jgi:dihydrofolate synthase/folylpolyglutamate synthase